MHSRKMPVSNSALPFSSKPKCNKKGDQCKARFKRYLTNKNSPEKDEKLGAKECSKGNNKAIDRIVLNLNHNSNSGLFPIDVYDQCTPVSRFELIDVSQSEVKRLDKMDILSKNLREKYATHMDAYNVKIVNDVISNEPTHIVAVFKDYLLYDDINDFLRRYYIKADITKKLSYITNYYSKYCTVFPNYINLEEK